MRLDGVPVQPMGASQHGYLVVAGRYRVEGDKLIVAVDTAWNEVWAGAEQTRTIERAGKRLSLIAAPQPSSTQAGKTLTSRSDWERLD